MSPEYLKYLSLPENRDPRAYILPADQADFPTAVKFVTLTFIKETELLPLQAEADFEVNGIKYPAGSFTYIQNRPGLQASYPRPVSEPQDHPNDFRYEGGPPIPPYDNAGYTLAFQMGIEFDRILKPKLEGPFVEVA
ncbi:MAG: hypothetical protein R2744_08710 [Bacteroidales bacterium]